MAEKREEDARVKIPALIHLSRLGYVYLSRKSVRRDRETNILTDVFRASLERLNLREYSEKETEGILRGLREELSRDDLGERFFDVLRCGREGMRLIDYEHPENNTYHVVTEMACVGVKHRFQPDITLILNGIPLAFVEVKDQGGKNSLVSEYGRMVRRARNPEFRRFINETQIMVFSDNGNRNQDGAASAGGAFYATTAYEELLFQPAGEETAGFYEDLPPVSPEAAEGILRDNGMDALPGDAEALLSPLTRTHRMLTSLFRQDRFLFLLRYGILYLKAGESGAELFRKRIVRVPRAMEIRDLVETPEKKNGILSAGSGERIPLVCLSIRYLRDQCEREGIRPVFYYITGTPEDARDAAEAFRIRNIPAETPMDREDFLKEMEGNSEPRDGAVRPVCLREDLPDTRLKMRLRESPIRRVCFLDESRGGYEPGIPLAEQIRSIDRNALILQI